MSLRSVTPLRLALAALAALPCLAAPARAQRPAAASPAATRARVAPPPRLLLFIAVDQLRPDYFERWGPQLTGGLGRLWRSGASFPNAYHDHAITETAPGHSVMLSGRLPRSTGIMLNDEGVQDPQAPLLGSEDEPASPYRFRGGVLFDWMRFVDPRSRALSVSRKDRGAILPLGRTKQSIYWYAFDHGFTTSRYYADTLPTWVRDFNARHPITAYAGHRWTPLLAEREYREPDADTVEFDKRQTTFPHVLPAAQPQLGKELRYDPVMDSLTLALAWTGFRTLRLGEGPQTDLLSISLSTTDAIGHRYGPDSRELHDQVLRADRYLGAFLDSLFRVVDSNRVAIALTADHGVAPFPGVTRSYDPVPRATHFINDTALVAPIRARLAARGLSPDFVRFDLGLLRVTRDSLRAHGVDPDSVTREAVAILRRTDGIASVRPVSALASADTANPDSPARLWLHSIGPGEHAAYVATPRPFTPWARAWYANHASPNAYDRRVPVIFVGPWFRPGLHRERIRVVDVAPTLARVLGVPVLEPVDGQVVEGALK